MAEMQRAEIHDLCLHARLIAPPNMAVRDFLQMASEPPFPHSIEKSMAFLELLRVLCAEATSQADMSNRLPVEMEPQLTNLGKLIAQLPLESQLG
ncbi:hypothetical protein KIN20_023957 [Parelaphostrongylus tenuis]|uniref:Uncharacterized protein n=1 Tax=Parelaphostrongylus tenuis TaxID=148309 RepID=A0AAD5NAJ3_PARTN|nr:hypothetical protein KIN20_023957 [Parelaphostrongylus tenuis]